MRRFLIILVVALLGVLGLAGCGGSGGGGFVGDNPDSGLYSGTYDRAGGKITVTVGKNSTVTVTVVDDTAGTFIGTGSLRSTEAFGVTCVGPNGASVIVEGSLQKSALSKKYVGKVKGSMTFSYFAPLALGNVTVTLFAGTYQGVVDMKNFDSFPATVVVDSNGFVLVNFTANGTAVQMKGLLYSDGHIILSPAEEQTLQYWGKGSAFMFADLDNLYVRCSISTKKDGPEVGVIRCQTPYLPG
jgi:hypothetical protein